MDREFERNISYEKIIVSGLVDNSLSLGIGSNSFITSFKIKLKTHHKAVQKMFNSPKSISL